MVAQNRYSVAIVGLGSRGQKTWFESLKSSPKISVCAVCDSSAAVLNAFAARCPEIPAYPSLEQLLEHHRPDFAIICLPNRYHLPAIKQLEAVNVPCLKEKPIAGTVDEFLQLCSVQTKIGVTFQRRWQPRYKHLRRLLPEVGKPLSVRATMAGRYDPPREGWRVRHNVGTFDDLGVHMLDVLVWLFGRPSSVFAHCLGDGQPAERDRESHVLLTWQRSELVGHLYVSEVALNKDESLVVRGTRGSLHLKGEDISHYDVGGRQTFQMSFQSLKQDVIVSMCQEFCEYISGRQDTYSTSVSEVEDTLLTTEAICLSFASHSLEQVAQPHQKAHQNGRQNGKQNGRPNGQQNGQQNGHQRDGTKVLDDIEKRPSTKKSNGHSDSAFTNDVCAKLLPTVDKAQKTFLLNNGYGMPGLGFGTRKPKRPHETYKAVKKALEVGYRHIDTAFRYNNEEQVGEAVRDSGLPREAVWVTTKVDNSWHHRVAESVRISLSKLDMEYIDLLLMASIAPWSRSHLVLTHEQHWPSPVDPEDTKKALPDWNFIMTWQDMQKEVQAGRVRSIGVSNFGVRNLQKLMSHPTCNIVPAVNQLEVRAVTHAHMSHLPCKANTPLPSFTRTAPQQG
ncbi:hypothetical protein LLEC1_01465 [Akanthomyces lecanii]|uniref:NADP-dependent oxidoreductase domain-containing protein n=1 Tax=Cordyceps confragosa TaxID=2714763 RepID=A0A179HZH7_CORDF|nr:hypothetical protein LLEC1_01465 [Akanthomyces lecanii]